MAPRGSRRCGGRRRCGVDSVAHLTLPGVESRARGYPRSAGADAHLHSSATCVLAVSPSRSRAACVGSWLLAPACAYIEMSPRSVAKERIAAVDSAGVAGSRLASNYEAPAVIAQRALPATASTATGHCQGRCGFVGRRRSGGLFSLHQRPDSNADGNHGKCKGDRCNPAHDIRRLPRCRQAWQGSRQGWAFRPILIR